MAKKSTKTAHVLNLISKPTEAKDTTTQEVAQGQEQTIPASSATPASPLLFSLKETAKNEELSDKIKDNLLAELLQEEETVAQSEPESNIPTSQDATASRENSNVSTSTVETVIAKDVSSEMITPKTEEPKTETTQITEKITQTPPATPVSDSNIDTPTQQTTPEPPTPDGIANTDEKEEFYFVNVCEMLIKDKVVEYLEKFGVCTCSRCVADTMALTLSNLTPKYVVTDEPDVIPFLSYYDSKFNNNIMTELTKACLSVDANPRHKPKNS